MKLMNASTAQSLLALKKSKKIKMINSTVIIVCCLQFLILLQVETRSLDKIRRAQRITSTSSSSNLRRLDIKFSCAGRPMGYYADTDFDCRIFHICDNFGRRIPMRCPTQTMFNQVYRVCDWKQNVQCQNSADWFHLNGPTSEIIVKPLPMDKNVNMIQDQLQLSIQNQINKNHNQIEKFSRHRRHR